MDGFLYENGEVLMLSVQSAAARVRSHIEELGLADTSSPILSSLATYRALYTGGKVDWGAELVHFRFGLPVMRSLAVIEQQMEGHSRALLMSLVGCLKRKSGVERHDAVLQWCAEVYVVAQLAHYHWPVRPIFLAEPRSSSSSKNPEVAVRLDGIGTLAVEVKAPRLTEYRDEWSRSTVQLTSRLPKGAVSSADSLKPRDNPVKDFLLSANGKFAGMKQDDPGLTSVLFIAWDDFVNEPLAALLAPSSGLLTENSFYREGGMAVKFPYLDCVVIGRQLHQFDRALQGWPPVDGRPDCFAFPKGDDFPPNVHVPVSGAPTPALPLAISALNSFSRSDSMGAEYAVQDMVLWSSH